MSRRTQCTDDGFVFFVFFISCCFMCGFIIDDMHSLFSIMIYNSNSFKNIPNRVPQKARENKNFNCNSFDFTIFSSMLCFYIDFCLFFFFFFFFFFFAFFGMIEWLWRRYIDLNVHVNRMECLVWRFAFSFLVHFYYSSSKLM